MVNYDVMKQRECILNMNPPTLLRPDDTDGDEGGQAE